MRSPQPGDSRDKPGDALRRPAGTTPWRLAVPDEHTPAKGRTARDVVVVLVALAAAVGVAAAVTWFASGDPGPGVSSQAAEACRMHRETMATNPPPPGRHEQYRRIFEAAQGAPEAAVATAARELYERSSAMPRPVDEESHLSSAGERLTAACTLAGA